MIGVDLDTLNHFNLVKTYFNAKYIADKIKGAHVDIYLSSSGRGYHVVIRGIESNADVRAYLGDDPNRLYESERRAGFGLRPPDDILFDRKRIRNGKWKRRKQIEAWTVI